MKADSVNKAIDEIATDKQSTTDDTTSKPKRSSNVQKVQRVLQRVVHTQGVRQSVRRCVTRLRHVGRRVERPSAVFTRFVGSLPSSR